jgi:hypothetical protein
MVKEQFGVPPSPVQAGAPRAALGARLPATAQRLGLREGALPHLAARIRIMTRSGLHSCKKLPTKYVA